MSAWRAALSAPGAFAAPHADPAPPPAGATPEADDTGSVATPTPASSFAGVMLPLGSGATLSHQSAAAVHGLWLPSASAHREVAVIVPGEPDRVDDGVRVRGSLLPPNEVEIVDGIRVTTVARTAIDCARGRSAVGALVALDSAMRLLIARETGCHETHRRTMRDATSSPQAHERARTVLQESLAGEFGWPGTRVVRAMLPLADPRSESPLESRSRGVFIDRRLPPATIGEPVRGASGRLYYGDFCWRRERVIGEADGWGKYGSGDAVRLAIAAERRRQQDLEAAGWLVLRWTSTDPLPQVAERVRFALARRHPYVA